VPMVWYGKVNVDLYSAIITKVSNALVWSGRAFQVAGPACENANQCQQASGLTIQLNGCTLENCTRINGVGMRTGTKGMVGGGQVLVHTALYYYY